MKFKPVALTAATVAALALTGQAYAAPSPSAALHPASTPAEPVELTVWNTWEDFHVEYFQTLLDEFHESHPNITITQQPQPLTDFDSKLRQAVTAGVGPDLVDGFPTEAADYVDAGLLVDLSDYIDDPEIGIPDFEASVAPGVYQEVTQWDGDVYLMPELAGGEVYYYNKTLFDSLGIEVPTTWAELETAARTITASTGKPAFGFDSEIDGFQVLISQQGSGYIDADTMTVEYNNPVAVQQLTWFCGLVDEGVFRLVGEDQYFSNPFGSEAVASYAGSAAGYGFVDQAVAGNFEFGVAPLPQGGEREYISSWGGGWMVFKTDEAKQRAAFEFLKWLQSPEVLARWATEFGGVPAYPAAIAEPVFQDFAAGNPAIQAQTEQINRVGFLPAVKGSAALRTVIGRAVASACTGVSTPEEALQTAEQEGNAELASANS